MSPRDGDDPSDDEDDEVDEVDEVVDDPWSVATGEDEGKPLIFRLRTRPPAWPERDAYPHLVAISWNFEDEGEGADGLPDPETVEGMELLEDRLVEFLEESEAACLTAVVTGNGVREWQWYARSPHGMMQILNEALAGLPQFPIEISAEKDPDWDGYRRLRRIFE